VPPVRTERLEGLPLVLMVKWFLGIGSEGLGGIGVPRRLLEDGDLFKFLARTACLSEAPVGVRGGMGGRASWGCELRPGREKLVPGAMTARARPDSDRRGSSGTTITDGTGGASEGAKLKAELVVILESR
jgi:hypothetical protein